MSILGKMRNSVGINRTNTTSVNKGLKVASRLMGEGGFVAPLTDTLIDTVAPTSVTTTQQRSSISGGSTADNNAYGMTRDAWMTKDVINDPMEKFNKNMAKWDTVQKVGQIVGASLLTGGVAGGGLAGGTASSGIATSGVVSSIPSFGGSLTGGIPTSSAVVPSASSVTTPIIPNVTTPDMNVTTPTQDGVNTNSIIKTFQDNLPKVNNSFDATTKGKTTVETVNNNIPTYEQSIATTNDNDLNSYDNSILKSYNNQIEFRVYGKDTDYIDRALRQQKRKDGLVSNNWLSSRENQDKKSNRLSTYNVPSF